MKEKGTIQKIRLEINEENFRLNLEKYCDLSKELGADDAKIITVDQIPLDERVTLKCRIPKCFGFGQCANCPPHSLKAEETRTYLRKYKHAVVFKQNVPSEVIVNDSKTDLGRLTAYQKVFNLVNKVESAAFYDGNYFAVGFAAGSCKSVLCWAEEKCAVLIGDKCRFSLKARPSMEAVGIDCFKLAVEIGWDIYPIGSDAKAEDFSHGTLMGLILIN